MPIRRVFITTFSFIVLLMAFAAIEARAQFADSKIPDLAGFDISTDEFLSKTDLYEETPFGDKYLAYQLRLPKNWTKQGSEITSTVDLSKKLLGEVARYYGPPELDARSYFVIQAAELDYEITAKNWFMNYILSRGYTLQGLKVHSDKRIEALYVFLDKDQTYVVRTVGEVNGSRMVLAMYYVPENRWQAEKALQSNALASFRFLAPETVKVEETRTYAFLDLLRFDYPASWRLLAPNIYSIEAMDAKIISAQEDSILDGEVDIHVVSTELDTTLAEEVKSVQKSLEEKGLVIGKLIEQPDDYKIQEHIYFSRIEIYQANDKDKELLDYEYWIGVLMEDRYFYIITMLTPSRNTDFYLWARNSEAFKTVVQSLRP
ncbi:MAG: hypothetical protein ACXW4B_11505 [Micavibrio sp.]